MPVVPASGGKCRRLAISWKPAWSIQYISGQPGKLSKTWSQNKNKERCLKVFLSPARRLLKKKKKIRRPHHFKIRQVNK